MTVLQKKKWHQFRLGELFDVSIGKNIDKIRVDSSGGEAYVTRKTTRNGLEGFIAADSALRNDNHPVITIGNETARPFVQAFRFFTGTKVNILSPRVRMSTQALLFVARCIEMSKDRFSYSFSANSTRLRSLCVMLPKDENGRPDFVFMDRYMRSVRRRLLAKYKTIRMCSRRVMRNVDFQSVSWGDFVVADLFRIESGRRLESYRMLPGVRPFVGAADSGNGVTQFVSNTNDSLDKNVLGVNYNGNGMGISFYHPYEALFSDDVKRFHLRQIPDDKYVLLFLKAAILKQKPKFDYGYKFNAERMARQRLVLPKTVDGCPDYEFMRKFMMNAETKIRKRYVKLRLES